jgi:hypothetical protein
MKALFCIIIVSLVTLLIMDQLESIWEEKLLIMLTLQWSIQWTKTIHFVEHIGLKKIGFTWI